MKLSKFNRIVNDTPVDLREDIKFSMKVLERIHELLDLKFNGKQKLLAEKMGKSEAEISKLLSGVQNFTTRTLMKLQIAFDAPIIAVCTETDSVSTFVEVKMTHGMCHKSVTVGISGIEEISTSYKSFQTTKKINP